MQTNDSIDAPPIVGTSYGPGRIQVFIDLWSGVFTRLTGDILEISVFMQTNDSNDALRTSAHPMVLKVNKWIYFQ
jgi:hypothetical protein